MKKMKCVHPRIAQRLMTEFLNTACDLLYNYEDNEVIDISDDDMSNWIIGDLIEYSEMINIRIRKGQRFCAEGITELADAEDNTLNIFYNFDELSDKGTKVFRNYWTNKCPMLKGFADITLALLHELGHFETTEEIRPLFSHAQRYATMYENHKKYKDIVSLNHAYFAMPDEKAATEWVIKWLSDADNRKIAKAFEKNFFKCFEKSA